MRYFLIGFMGSGKSYWGKRWSEHFGLPLIELDHEIEKAAGKTIAEIFEKEGENGFRKLERKILYTFLKQDNYIMSCGGGTPCFFHNMKKMNHKGVTIYLKSSPELLAERIKGEKGKRPLLKDLSQEGLISFISNKLEERSYYYSQSIYHLETIFLTNDNFERILRRHGS
ncbi:MAG: shikimate kinase [Bacteroidota bacterium]|jgi:shikimate kinase